MMVMMIVIYLKSVMWEEVFQAMRLVVKTQGLIKYS